MDRSLAFALFIFLIFLAIFLVAVLLNAARRSRIRDQRQPMALIAPATTLATRVRNLKEMGRTEQAVFLVRGETGMDESEAIRFVSSL